MTSMCSTKFLKGGGFIRRFSLKSLAVMPAAMISPLMFSGGAGRIFVLDVLRGIAISIVIFGHALQKIYGASPPHPVHKIILCFQMELFFVIAGYTASLTTKGRFWSSLVKKVNRLLLPYLIWVTMSFVYGLYTGIAHWDFDSIWRYYFIHQFWFLRTMFYASVVHLIAGKLYGYIALKHSDILGIVVAGLSAFIFAMFVRDVLCDVSLPRYLIWFYIGFGLRFFIKLKADSKEHSLLGNCLAFLGRESLALYALHWWIFFSFLPIPQCLSRHYTFMCACAVFVVWTIASIIIDAIMSRMPYLRYLIGKGALRARGQSPRC